MDRALADMKQCLIHHLQNTAKEALNFAKDLYLEIISQRLYVVSEGTLKLHPTSLRRIIHVSSLLHDIGKAADQYQNQFTRCISNPNFKPSFLLHEVPSAVICYRFACTLNAEDEEIFFMTFSTLNHMNAMRPLQKIKLLLKQMYNKNWSFLRWGSSMLPIFEEISISYASELMQEVTYIEAEKLLQWCDKIINNRNLRWPKLYSLIMNPIIYGDNVSALERGDQMFMSASRKKFIKELKEALI